MTADSSGILLLASPAPPSKPLHGFVHHPPRRDQERVHPLQAPVIQAAFRACPKRLHSPPASAAPPAAPQSHTASSRARPCSDSRTASCTRLSVREADTSRPAQFEVVRVARLPKLLLQDSCLPSARSVPASGPPPAAYPSALPPSTAGSMPYSHAGCSAVSSAVMSVSCAGIRVRDHAQPLDFRASVTTITGGVGISDDTRTRSSVKAGDRATWTKITPRHQSPTPPASASPPDQGEAGSRRIDQTPPLALPARPPDQGHIHGPFVPPQSVPKSPHPGSYPRQEWHIIA